jgi:hypothetical protein
MQIVPGEGYVPDIAERLDPGDPLALLGPERLVVAHGARLHVIVGLLVDQRVRFDVGRYGVNFTHASIPGYF